MTLANLTRRSFVTGTSRAAAAGWIAMQLPWLATLAGCARGEDAALERLTPPQARTLEAFAAQIIPADESGPGAVEAGAVHFIDRAIGTPYFADAAVDLRACLADLDSRASALGSSGGFAALSSRQQTAIMRQIEATSAFAAARTLVLVGTFADPSYGGNVNGTGWTLVDLDHRPSYTAPFGWYDARPETNAVRGDG